MVSDPASSDKVVKIV